jgi:hypothetical protein
VKLPKVEMRPATLPRVIGVWVGTSLAFALADYDGIADRIAQTYSGDLVSVPLYQFLDQMALYVLVLALMWTVEE